MNAVPHGLFAGNGAFYELAEKILSLEADRRRIVRLSRGDRAILRRVVDEHGEVYQVVDIGSHDLCRDLGWA